MELAFDEGAATVCKGELQLVEAALHWIGGDESFDAFEESAIGALSDVPREGTTWMP